MMVKLFSWNVNGIRAVHNKGLFSPFIKKYQPDILCLQETKIDADTVAEWRGTDLAHAKRSFLRQGVAIATSRSKKSVGGDKSGLQLGNSVGIDLPAEQHQSEVDFKGYDEYWNSAEKKGYSGTAIFSKVQPQAVINGLPEDIIAKYKVTGDIYGDPNKEGRVIAAEYDQFFVVTVYTPNAKDDLSRIPLRQTWDPAFLEYCKRLEKKKSVVFCGDLNVAHMPDDLARPKENEGKKGFTKEERTGFQAFIDAGFVDTFRLFHQGNGHYTWWTHWANARARNVGWRIDYILVSGTLKGKVKTAEIHPDVMGSDHCPVSIDLALDAVVSSV